jgi:NADH-quinone oxidoreductase subunit J
MVAQNITFGILAAAAVLGALRVVTTKNVVHAALYLVVVLASVGANYLLLAAEFVAVVQYLVYIGAIVVLFLFGVMLTRARMGHEAELDNNQRGLAAVVGLFLAGILTYVLVDYTGDLPHDKLPELAGTVEQINRTRGTAPVGDAIFSTYVVPFEVVSVLLLAALVGAIVIARRD